MDRDEALRLLRCGEEGIEEWNRRRKATPDIAFLSWSRPNLQHADLRGADLTRADLRGADLTRADLTGADLTGADLRRAKLREAKLREAKLPGADLRDVYLSEADLSGADLREAKLPGADLSEAALSGANLRGADLTRANLNVTKLAKAACVMTNFGDLDLSVAVGLEFVRHLGPSTIGTDTLFRSGGKIPERFLRGCGLTPWEVIAAKLYDPALTPPRVADLQYTLFDAWTKGRSMINGCFISYSWKNSKFIDKLHDRLMSDGINVWRDKDNMLAGTIQDQVWRAIQVHQVVILVLSKDSIESDWVENELEMARAREKADGRAVLCPIALDDAWKDKVAAKDKPGDPNRALWRTLTSKLIVDFSKRGGFDEAFQTLLRGLQINYGPGTAPVA